MWFLMSQRKGERAMSFLVSVSLLLLLGVEDILLTPTHAKTNVYIVYMGIVQHDDPELITQTHLEMLTTVLASKEASADSMVYSYKHGFSGFAAKLTEPQAQAISELPGVVHVIPNGFCKPQTTRTWDYLGLDAYSSTNLLHETKMGDGVIIGLIDTGIWPESEVFNDEGLVPIPSRWKGFCESGESFIATKNCNRKLIGARHFIKGFLAELGKPYNTTENQAYLSTRDSGGHGTSTSAIAGGSFVTNVSYYNGLGHGTVRGGAPRARLAMYKVCWNFDGGVCAYADILKAFDEAIHDGVNVLSVSLVTEIPLFSDVDMHGGMSFGSFHAVVKGITVVCAAGNSGPSVQTIQNTAPWVITVGASTVDRSFPTSITLGNNQTFMGNAIFTGKDTGFTSLMYPEVSELIAPRYCESLLPNDTSMAGNVVLCFTLDDSNSLMESARLDVEAAGGVGIIVAKNPSNSLYYCDDEFPCVQVSYETGTQILFYIRSTRHPLVRLKPSKSHVGKPVPTKVAYFSSRGPNPVSPAILKPDIVAPGQEIFSAVGAYDQGYAFVSGTSFAAPHVSGIVALLKSLHSDWSPAAIKSALVTTAWTTDPSGEPIFAEGKPTKLADPFDFGGGLVNPNRARDPGLIYDMGIANYIHYLCAMGYNDTSITQLTESAIFCPKKPHSILDLNLPSITIPSLRSSVTVTRTVANVGNINSRYKALINSPAGIKVAVKPDSLIFNSKIRTVSFNVTISTSQQTNTGYCFGALTWTDGVHEVRSPISVKTVITEYFSGHY